MASVGEKVIPRGKGWYNTGAEIASGDWGANSILREGTTRTFAAKDPSNRLSRRHGGEVICELVRNTSDAVMLPKHLVAYESGYEGRRVDTYTNATAQRPAGVVDEFWPAGGVPVGELFWLVKKGDTLWKSGHTAAAGNVISAGYRLVAITGNGTTANDAGHFSVEDLTGATALLADQVHNSVAIALSANTTNQTDRDVLVRVTLL